MNIETRAGRWVVAVSGGVDSMVLLDLLARKLEAQRHRDSRSMELVVAHFDHGIRDDSSLDRKLVQETAKKHGFQFVYDLGSLGSGVSESVARDARYRFLHKVREMSGSTGIITAHHYDDLLETAIHNLIRGTGRRGLTSLGSSGYMYRPLLGFPKQLIKDYAAINNLSWNEDSTNLDIKYTRNYIRKNIIPKLSDSQKYQLNILIQGLYDTNEQIDNMLSSVIHLQSSADEIDRKWFVTLDNSLACELIHLWLRAHEIPNITKRMIDRIVVAGKVGRAGRVENINASYNLLVDTETIKLVQVLD